MADGPSGGLFFPGTSATGTPASTFDYGKALSQAGGATSDLFSAAGDFMAIGNYKKAAALADENAALAFQSAQIKEAAIGRELTLTQGQAASAISSNGFDLGGSGLDILRANAQQGSLATAMAGEQGLANKRSYEEQASAYRTEAKAANMAGIGSLAGAALSVAAIAVML